MVFTLALETLLAKSPGNEKFDCECILVTRRLMLPADVSEDGGVDETGGKVRAMVGRIVLRRRSWLGLVGIVVGIKTTGYPYLEVGDAVTFGKHVGGG